MLILVDPLWAKMNQISWNVVNENKKTSHKQSFSGFKEGYPEGTVNQTKPKQTKIKNKKLPENPAV